MARKHVGALWTRTYEKDGESVKYLSGVVDLGALGEVSIAVFKNDNKEKQNHPDWRIVISEKQRDDSLENTKERQPF